MQFDTLEDLTINGEKLTMEVEPGRTDARLGAWMLLVLRKPIEREDNDGPSIYHRGAVWTQIHQAMKDTSESPIVDLSIEDVGMIKKRVPKAVPDPLVVKALWDVLEGKSTKESAV